MNKRFNQSWLVLIKHRKRIHNIRDSIDKTQETSGDNTVTLLSGH